MPLGPRWLAAIAPTLGLACAVGLAGCSSGGGLMQRGPSVGSLKTAVSRLEFENEKLRREVADARADNQRIADQLAQVDAANTDLTARLGQFQGGSPGDDPAVADGAVRARPAGGSGSGSGGRKPPVARIPGQGQAIPSLDDIPVDDQPPRRKSTRSSSPDTGYRSEDDQRWLPIARDTRPVQVR
ncbi:MAG: hypothetical protein U0800_27445 [Isosphaeraceae bacterium]